MSDAFKEERFVVMGQIVTAHGIRGGVKIKSFTQSPRDLFSFTPFWIGATQEQGWLRWHAVGKDHFIAFLKGVNDRTAALGLRGQWIKVLRGQLPDVDDSVYYADLQGRQVQDAQGRFLGCVEWVHNFGAGIVLDIKDTDHMVALQDIHNVDDPVLRLKYTLQE